MQHVTIVKENRLLHWALKLETRKSLKLFYTQLDRPVLFVMKVSLIFSILLFHFERTYDLGIQKLDSLSKFLDSVLDGTADLSTIIEEAKSEEFTMDEAELEIERQQEIQRIALLHGGYTNLIDFEKALKDGAGAGYHDSHGYVGVMGGVPEHLKKPSAASFASTPATTSTASTAADTTTPLRAEDEAVDAPESIKTPEPVVDEEEHISEQVIFEVVENRDAEASTVGCQGKGNAESQLWNDGVQESCTMGSTKRRSEDEL